MAAGLAGAAALLLALTLAATVGAATTSIVFTPCPNLPGWGCGDVAVPLDPSGDTPGTVTLAVERKLAVSGDATQAVVGLAGGPGQAAIPFASDLAQAMAPALATRDMIVFDQRGTGASGALDCPAFDAANATLTGPLLATCATQLGSSRAFYTTDDSVADLEQLRVQLGYSQLVLYGTSYGTKVAERYAEQYPADTAGLVLDSVVPPNGPDIYNAATFAAIPHLLAELCAHNGCGGITQHPVADLDALVARLNSHVVHATYIGDHGRAHHLRVYASEIFDILVAGDLDPPLRAAFPAALAAAVHRDYAPLAVLITAAEQPEGGVNLPLYFSTVCEELPFPWDRSTPTSTRAAAALAAFQALPASTFAPFTSATAYGESDAPFCANWPFATSSPESTTGTLPNVPTLIFSGAEDLRTPTANADALAAQIPDATVLVVPHTGHSVVFSDPTDCSEDAVKAFFDDAPIKPCAQTGVPSFLRPDPLAPRSVVKLRPARGTTGLAGRAAAAVLATIRQANGDALSDLLNNASLSGSIDVGGLRAGWAAYSLESGLALHRYSYIPGVNISGKIGNGNATVTLTVRGRYPAQLAYDPKSGTLSGVIAGSDVQTKSANPLTHSTARALRRIALARRAFALG
jgi:pimeloyl-ACP methyl ester carboxylesterase